MEHYYHLVETSSAIDIGHVEVAEDARSFSVKRPMSFKGVMVLLTSEGKPVFEANAFILNRRIVQGVKDINPTCFHLLRYYRFLDANRLKWDDHEEQLQRYPIFLYRAYLDGQIERGKISRNTAVAALSIARRFYLFCYRHGYISELPFEITGVTKYGQTLTDCTIRSQTRDTNLQPLNDLDLQHVRDNWHYNGLSMEFRLMVSVMLCVGLRAIEVADIKPDHFVIPKGFNSKTLTGIWIGPDHQCKTKYDINRQVSMPVWLMKSINQYHQSERYKKRQQLYFMSTGDMNPPAFINKDGGRFTTQSLNTLWGKLRKAIKENSNPHFKHKQHDCRATFGAYKLDSLAKIPELSMLQALEMLKKEMGHKDLDTTMLYLKHYEGSPEKNQVPEITMNLLEGEALT
ncbi:MAG: site-specific integrase [Pseudomonadota bacterium]|nr:integrase [Cellvibrionaceae bacterium]MCP4528095.1 site-specific integrase [Aestuariibacter sp.]|tara:strand:- start:4228 stop:5433 length:1206 start_codon:yes stop_codon:yes gene_type:complete